MRPSSKSVQLVLDTQATAGETNTGIIDRLGAEFASIDVNVLGIETNAACTEIALQQSNDTNASNFANISGCVGGTDFTIPTANITLGGVGMTTVRYDVDCRSLKRYLRVKVAAATKDMLTVNARLSLIGEAPYTAAPAGVSVLVAI